MVIKVDDEGKKALQVLLDSMLKSNGLSAVAYVQKVLQGISDVKEEEESPKAKSITK